jgi:hypothetical protein
MAWMDTTEADDSQTPHEALLALRHIAEKVYQGQETHGVLAMYELAARKKDCDPCAVATTLHAARERVRAGLVPIP